MTFKHPYKRQTLFMRLWDSFWEPPGVSCPKCGSPNVTYFDPFFFSIFRTLENRRRKHCRACGLIWRSHRESSSIFTKISKHL
jgi:hypothetical protein